MNQSIPPQDEVALLLRQIREEQQKQRDQGTEILIRIKGQDERIQTLSNGFTGINQRMVKIEDKQAALERKAERTAQHQEALEGDVLREVAVLAANDRKQNTEIAEIKADGQVIKAETHKQSAVLAKQNVVLERIAGWEEQLLLLVKLFKNLRYAIAGIAVVASGITWVIAHFK